MDNVGDVYAFTSGGSKCAATQGIVDAVIGIQKAKRRLNRFAKSRELLLHELYSLMLEPL